MLVHMYMYMYSMYHISSLQQDKPNITSVHLHRYLSSQSNHPFRPYPCIGFAYRIPS